MADRIVRAVILAGLLTALVFVGLVLWLESPSGARSASEWLSNRLVRDFPGTRITIGRIDFHGPFEVELRPVRWKKKTGPTILELDRMVLKSDPSAWLLGQFRWWIHGRVKRLDLSTFDSTVTQGQWGAQGTLEGWASFSGIGSRLDRVRLKLEAQAPGGTLNNEFLRRLIDLMPAGDVRATLLKAIQQGDRFHFQVGRIETATEPDGYRLNLLLDGDHLLDITIRIPREGFGLFKELIGKGA